jgi:phosphatidylglycerophosphatase A
MSHEDDFQEPELPQALLPPGFLKDPVHLLAFGLGSGAMARAPGTWGSLAAIPVWYLFAWVPGPVYWGGGAGGLPGGDMAVWPDRQRSEGA